MPIDDNARPSPPPQAVAAWLAVLYRGSQAMISATRLGVPDALGKGARTSAEVAQATATNPEMMHRLLRALAAFGVVRDLGDGRFELTAVGDCLRADAPQSVRPLVLMWGSDSSWQACSKLAECVRTGENAYRILHDVDNLFPYLDKDPEQARIFDAGQSAGSAVIGSVAAQAYDFTGIGRVVDVGGGHGKVLASILKAHPGLRGTLFDLPRVAEGAAASLAAEGVADRCEAVGGDMFQVPAGGDSICSRMSFTIGAMRTPPGAAVLPPRHDAGSEATHSRPRDARAHRAGSGGAGPRALGPHDDDRAWACARAHGQ
jgi:hypothetical protein